MTVTKDDFEKVWASQSPLTPYSFSDSQYKEGWNFVGATPPSRQMWDAFMQNADEKLKYLYQHEDVPLGHEYFTFNPNIPQGSLPLFGGEYSRETYSDLWNWVQQQTGYLKTEAEWQTLSASNNGNVPYYSDGDGSTTFRVPSLKCWVKGANGTVSEVGSYLEAGLPNITGTVPTSGIQNRIDAGNNGAFSWTRPNQYNSFGSNTQIWIGDQSIAIDASRSSSIYGNANTVVPESIVGMWLVKAYGVIVDTGQIDEQQYIDDRMADLKNVYLPANYLSFSTGIDLSVFADLSSFITPAIYNNRLNNLSGGYKRVGNIVYVSVSFLPNTLNAAGTWDLLTGFPLPYHDVPIPFFADLGDNANSAKFVWAKIKSNGNLIMCVNASVSIDTDIVNHKISVEGYYYSQQ